MIRYILTGYNLNELDGLLIPHQRLLRLSAHEALNFAYAHLVDGADHETRLKIDAALSGNLGEGGGQIVNDPDLPDAMQGMEAPAWWSSDEDPFQDTFTVG